jgi:DNA-binding Lrp family transcriptional regulator
MEDRRDDGALVERGRKAASEAGRDREMLAWIGRFRFVTAEVLAKRFGVSVNRVNVRLARLERAGLVTRYAASPTHPRAIYLTPLGASAIGRPRRRAPRADAHREHEHAITTLVTQLELANQTNPSTRILTERDARTLEATTDSRYSVDVASTRHGLERRWPDVIIETPERRTAIEIEFADKGAGRLRRIIDGYRSATTFDEVRFLVSDAPLRKRIEAYAQRPAPAAAELLGIAAPAIVVASWPSQ